MSVPYRFDDSVTERSGANAGLDIGVTQAISAARAANRPDKSSGLVGIGDAGSASQNPMGINAPVPAFVQPGTAAPDPSKIATIPAPSLNAMGIPAVSPAPYQQPNVITPTARATTTPTVRNPMGL